MTSDITTNRPTLKSRNVPGLAWELWRTGTGQRAIMERYTGGYREIAVLKSTRKGRRWDIFLQRWSDRIGSNYKSDIAAFRALVASLSSEKD